jgi:hypothetical protein
MKIGSLIQQLKKDQFKACCTVTSRDPVGTVHYYGERESFTEILCFLLGVLSKPKLDEKTIYREIMIETLALLGSANNEKTVELFQYRQGASENEDSFQAYENRDGEILSSHCSEDNTYDTVGHFLDPRLGYGRIFLHFFPLSARLIELGKNNLDLLSQGAFTAGLEAISSQKD